MKKKILMTGLVMGILLSARGISAAQEGRVLTTREAFGLFMPKIEDPKKKLIYRSLIKFAIRRPAPYDFIDFQEAKMLCRWTLSGVMPVEIGIKVFGDKLKGADGQEFANTLRKLSAGGVIKIQVVLDILDGMAGEDA